MKLVSLNGWNDVRCPDFNLVTTDMTWKHASDGSLAVGEPDLIRELSNLTSDYNLQSAEVSVSTDRNLDWISW